MGVELLLDKSLSAAYLLVLIRHELSLARLAHRQYRYVFDAPQNPKTPLWHSPSLHTGQQHGTGTSGV